LQKFRVDELYGWIAVKPTRAMAVTCNFLDTYVVDRLVHLVAQFPRSFGRTMLARYQDGLIQNYASISAISITFLLFFLLVMKALTGVTN
jgi:NADH-quinone oxidoreductase subunit L